MSPDLLIDQLRPYQRMVRESIFEVTLNDKRAGKLALITPVIT